VKRGAERLLETIVDILDVTALTTGSLHLDTGDVEVRSLLESIEEVIRPRAVAKGLRFRCGVDDDAPALVHGDRVRIHQMLLHLAMNAVKFTDGGEIVIRASRPEGVEVSSLRFTVVDTGIGVAPRDQWRLFRVFSQVDPTDTRRFEGNGLGSPLWPGPRQPIENDPL
jgi:signal transduction histidine kinase